MATIAAVNRKQETNFMSREHKSEQINYSQGKLEVLDLDFDKIFISVNDFKEADIDSQGNLILEHFVNDQMLAEEGIPLTCDDMRTIFNTRCIQANRQNLKAG